MESIDASNVVMEPKEKESVTLSFLNSLGCSCRSSVEEAIQNQDILVQILIRLPVKSLFKMCCISKSWYSLISSRYFISIHTHFTIISANNFNIMSPRCHLMWDISGDLCRRWLSFVFTDYNEKNSIRCQKVYYPSGSDWEGYDIVGSCYGLVCLALIYKSVETEKPIILWNPCVREFITLPTYENDSGTLKICVGFGFDFKIFDYKVIRVIYKNHSSDPVLQEIDIFELNVGIWRSIKKKFSPSIPFTLSKFNLFLNGAIHGIGFKDDDLTGRKWIIVVFDVSNEGFWVMDVPDEVNKQNESYVTISTLENSLCLLHLDRDKILRIWIMKEYGVVISWTKLYDARLPYFTGFYGVYEYGKVAMMVFEEDGSSNLYDISGEIFQEPYDEIDPCIKTNYMEVLQLWKGHKGILGNNVISRVSPFSDDRKLTRLSKSWRFPGLHFIVVTC